MGQITQFFQPPLYWQQFEDLTQAVVEIVYGTSHADKIGRPGQSQDGVDVHAGRSRAGALGVQCKRMDNLDENNLPLPGGAITRKILIEEITKAKTFQPQLDVWILATTAKRDARIQETARRIDRQHAKQKLFEVKLWFWDDYVAFLNSYSDLQAGYYDQIIRLRSPLDQDRLILETIATAFDRPAFTDPLNVEQVDDMLEALADTRAALKTGQLVDRRSRHVIRKAVGGWRYLEDKDWQARMQGIDERLTQVRTALVLGLKDGRLSRSGSFLTVQDPVLRRELEQGRMDCLLQLNELLVLAALPTI
ncbi:hypothetical protein [Sphingobium sp. BS19]|uniref:hypothetical protein n=1 Tax=Sphingobium sp. BS19 TaxID=3018973 RepID=UPI0022EDCC25|nr:hypothetical protein [Sphingobium sp. BS19]GLI99018.1 hypothetical protein Sbs19_28360 [Sphingobium sp. BS19]